MIELGLGDATTVYRGWAAQMKSLGAELSAIPNDPKPIFVRGVASPRVAAVFRNPAVWAALVNARQLPMPDVYSRDGRTAYYLAPPTVQQAYAKMLEQGIIADADRATPGLMDQWGIPSPLQGFGNLVNSVKWAGGLLLAWWALDRFVTRGNRK